MSYSIAGSTASDNDSVMLSPYAGGNHVMSGHGVRRKTGQAANASVVTKYRVTGGTGNFGRRYMEICPIRVNA
jgi:hypothetical protein